MPGEHQLTRLLRRKAEPPQTTASFDVPDFDGTKADDDPDAITVAPELLAQLAGLASTIRETERAATTGAVETIRTAATPPPTGLREVPRITIKPEVEAMLRKIASVRPHHRRPAPPPRTTARARTSIGRRRTTGRRVTRRAAARSPGRLPSADDPDLTDYAESPRWRASACASSRASSRSSSARNSWNFAISRSMTRSHSEHTGFPRSAGGSSAQHSRQSRPPVSSSQGSTRTNPTTPGGRRDARPEGGRT